MFRRAEWVVGDAEYALLAWCNVLTVSLHQTGDAELELPLRARPHRLGIFNVVEGLIDHQILGVHHVRDDLGGPLSWDMGFLIFGVLLIVGGWSMHKAGLRTLERRALTTR